MVKLITTLLLCATLGHAAGVSPYMEMVLRAPNATDARRRLEVSDLPGGLSFVPQYGTANLTNWSAVTVFSTNGLQGALGYTPQFGDADLTNWAALATSAKQDALGFVPQYGTANLTNWSALATGAKQDADADLDDLADGSLTGSKVGTGIAAGNITTGTVDPARLGSGSSITTKYLRGDSTWQSVAGGSQTPWTSDINADAFSLTNVLSVAGSNGVINVSSNYLENVRGITGPDMGGVNYQSGLYQSHGGDQSITMYRDNFAPIEYRSAATPGHQFFGEVVFDQIIVGPLTIGTLTVTNTLTGSGANLTNLSGTEISSGTVADARIAAAIARLASPALTGTPTAPTAAANNNSTQIATTAYVDTKIRALALASAVTNSTTNAAKITGLDATTGTGTFVFQYYLRYQSTLTGTGVKFSVNHSGTVTSFVFLTRYASTGGGAATGAASMAAAALTGNLHESWARRAKSTAGDGGITASVDAANADMLTIIEGLCVVTVSGDLQLYHGSETAAATSIQPGSALILTKIL